MSKHRERQLNRITGAVLNIVERDGFGQLNMASVAQESGLTRQTIYNYFPDVESIIAAAVDQHIIAREAHLLEVIGAVEGVENKLSVLAEFLFAIASADHQQISLEMGLSAAQRRKIDQQNDRVKLRLVVSLQEDFSETGIRTSITPSVLVDVLWGMIEGAAEAAKDHQADKAELLDLVRRALNLVLKLPLEE